MDIIHIYCSGVYKCGHKLLSRNPKICLLRGRSLAESLQDTQCSDMGYSIYLPSSHLCNCGWFFGNKTVSSEVIEVPPQALAMLGAA